MGSHASWGTQSSAGDSNTLGPGPELSSAMDPDASRRPESAMGSNIALRSHQTSAGDSNTLGPGPELPSAMAPDLELSSTMAPIASQHPKSAIGSWGHQAPAIVPIALQRRPESLAMGSIAPGAELPALGSIASGAESPAMSSVASHDFESTLHYRPPTRLRRIRKIGPCGGPGGELRDDMRPADDVTRIEQIKVWYGTTVEAIQVYYKRDDRREATAKWGGNVNKAPAEIFFKKQEYINCVKGYIDSYKYGGFKLPGTQVRSIKFETNLGATFGPYGPEEGAPFELSGAGEIIGLYARSGVILNAIGVYIRGTYERK